MRTDISRKESYFTYPGQPDSPVNHDISFRPGLSPSGTDTYTPRTLIYDLKGGFGTLRRENALYELQQQSNPAQDGPFSSTPETLRLPPIQQSPYQQALDEGTTLPELTTEIVRYWSDYNHLFYHPRSIVQLNEYELNSELMPFEKWSTGEDLFDSLDREHDLLDRDLRPWLEECDQLQALQIFSGIDDAWGGFTAKYLERIADELGKGCRWVFGLNGPKLEGRQRQMLQMANLAQSLTAIDSCASVHVPVSAVPEKLPEYVQLDTTSPWHTSALQTAVVESLTLPARLRGTESARAGFGEMETTLDNDGNRRLAAAGLTFEDPEVLEDRPQTNGQRDGRMTNGLTHDYDDEDEDTKTDISTFPDMSIAPAPSTARSARRTHTFTATTSLRGPWESPESIASSNAASRDPFHSTSGPRTATHQSSLLFPLLSSYPKIIRFGSHRPEKVAVKTVLSTSSAVADEVRELERGVRRLVGVEDREALGEGLARMAGEYEEGWSDGLSSSGDEDE